MKKAQMEFSTIMKIVLALLVLTTVILLFTGGMRKIGGTLSRQSSGIASQSDLSSARTICSTDCLSMESFLSKPSDARSQPYCTRVFKLAEDGVENDDDKCYDPILAGGSSCRVTLTTGSEALIDASVCAGSNSGSLGRTEEI